MQPIFTQTVGAGGASQIIFQNIPAFYTDIQLVVSARSTSSFVAAGLDIQFNSDNASNYSFTVLRNINNISDSFRSSNATFISCAQITAANGTANTFSNVSIYIPNYVGTQFKQIIIDGVTESDTSAFDSPNTLRAGLYRSTNGINYLKLSTANNFAQHSTLTLYGITKG